MFCAMAGKVRQQHRRGDRNREEPGDPALRTGWRSFESHTAWDGTIFRVSVNSRAVPGDQYRGLREWERPQSSLADTSSVKQIHEKDKHVGLQETKRANARCASPHPPPAWHRRGVIRCACLDHVSLSTAGCWVGKRIPFLRKWTYVLSSQS